MRSTGLAFVCVAFFCVAFGAFLTGCPDLSTICPYKPISQGVFGEIVDGSGTLEQSVAVDIYTMLNGVQDTKVAGIQTSRGGYQFNMLPGSYLICAKTVCTTIVVPTGLVELSATDAPAGLTWNTPLGVPPDQMIGPCNYGP